MKRNFIAAGWQAAALAAVILGVAAFLWAPDSHWLWLAASALLVAVVPLSAICLQSAAMRAVSRGRGSLGFQILIGLLLFAGVALVWHFSTRWYWWALFWLAAPPVLGPAFAEGRWARPRFSFWFVGAALVPTLLMRWTPRLDSVSIDLALLIVRVVLAGAILVGGLVMAMNDWAPRERSKV
jgi:hypothetical protein